MTILFSKFFIIGIMKLSNGRRDDNFDLYTKSFKIYEELNELIRIELFKNGLIGGYFGILDAWCLVNIQYLLTKIHDFEDINFPRPLLYKDVINNIHSSNYRNEKINKFINIKNEYIINEKFYLFKEDLFDEKFILKKFSNTDSFKTFNVKIKIVRGDEEKNLSILKNLKNKLIKIIEKYLDQKKSIIFSDFLVKNIPEIYLKRREEIDVYGIQEILVNKINSFIRTSKSIVDVDISKILAADLKLNGVKLKTIDHGGNRKEILYNSIYKLDEILSDNYFRRINFDRSGGLIRYKKNFVNIRKGIVIYLNPRRIENSFFMGSRTNEDFPKYMGEIIEAFGMIKKKVRNEFLIMRHLDNDITNLGELTLHISKNQLFSMNSLKKKLYRRIFTPKLNITRLCGSVLIESIYSDIPCVLYTNLDSIELSNRMKDIIPIFLESKILHTNADSLASFLNSNINFKKWWNEKKTLEAKEKYLEVINS